MIEKIKFIRFGGLSAQKQTHRKKILKEMGEPGCHTPPRKNGIYAFPYGYVDMFLLGATYHPSNKSGKSSWLKDEKGNLIPINSEWEYDDKYNKIIFPKEIKKLIKKLHIKEKNVWNCKINPEEKKFECDKDGDIECEECSQYKECNAYSTQPEYLVYFKNPRVFEYTGELWHHLIETTPKTDIIETWGNWVKTSYNDYLIAFDKDRHKTLKNLHQTMKQYNAISKLNDHKGRNNPYNKSPEMTYSKDMLEVFIENV